MAYQPLYNPVLDESPSSTNDAPSWSDYGKAGEEGAIGVASSAASGMSYLADEAGYTDAAQLAALNAHSLRGQAQDVQGSMTPAGQQATQTWNRPLSHIAMGATEMAPGLVAAMIPAALGAGPIGAGLVGGALSAGDLADNIASHVDDMTPDQLPSAYQEMLKYMPEQQVKDMYRDSLANGDARMAVAAAAGAVGGGGVAGRFASKAAGGFARGVITAAGEGAVQGAGTNAAEQGAGIAGGWQDQANTGEYLGNVAVGLATGAAFGIAHGVGGHFEQTGSGRDYRKSSTDKQPNTNTNVEARPDDISPDAAQEAALKGAPVQPTAPQVSDTTPESNAAPATDTAQAETPETLQIQQQELIDGKRTAMVFKGGENLLSVPDGFKQTKISGDVYQYDPDQMSPKQLRAAIKSDTIGEILRLGQVTKDEAAARVQAGETPTAVTERTPDGTEVRAAAGTDQTAPTQTAEFQQTAEPGNTVQVENPAHVIEARVEGQPEAQPASTGLSTDMAGRGQLPSPEANALPTEAPMPGPRILQDITPEGKAAAEANVSRPDVAKNLAEPTEEVASAGHRTKGELAARQNLNTESERILSEHGLVPTSRLEAVQHAGRVTEAAKTLKIPSRMSDSVDEAQALGPHAMAIAEARKIAKLKRAGEDSLQRYRDSVTDALTTNREDFAKQRREEGYSQHSVGEVNDDLVSHAEEPQDETERELEDRTAEIHGEPPPERNEDVTPVDNTPAVAGGRDMSKVQVAKKRRIVLSKQAAGNEGRIQLDDVPLDIKDTTTLRDALDQSKLVGGHAGEGEDVSNAVSQRISELVGDVPVHQVPHDQLAQVFGGRAAYGAYDPVAHAIVISDQVPLDLLPHTVLHEGVHAAVLAAMRADRYARNNIRNLMLEFREAIPKNLHKEYAFTDEDEFVAELLSSPDMRDLAMNTKMSPQLARRLGIADWRAGTKFQGVLPSLWHGFWNVVAKALGLPPHEASVLEGVMSEFEQATHLRDRQAGQEFNSRVDEAQRAAPMLAPEDTQHEASDPRGSMLDHQKLLSSVSDQIAGVKSWGDELSRRNSFKFLSNDQLRQAKESLFGEKSESNPVRRLVDGIEKASVRMRKLLQPADSLASTLNQLRVQDPEQWDKLTQLMNDSTMHNVHPDVSLGDDLNRHLQLPVSAKGDESEGAMRNWQARAKHEDLSRDYNSLSEPYQRAYQEARDYYAGERDARVKQHIEAVIGGHEAPDGMTPEEVLDQIFQGGGLDDDVKEHYDQFGIGKTLGESEDLQRTTGPYFPLKRTGDYVASGKRELNTPAGATRVTDNAFDFGSRDSANRYVKGQSDHVKVQKVYYDPDTGTQIKASEKADIPGNPTEKYRVTVENNHVSFHQTEAEARAMTEAMRKDGFTMNEPDLRRQGKHVEYGLRSSQTDALISAVNRRTDLSDNQKRVLAKSLEESSIALQRGNRIESTFLKRKNVGGASTDAIKTLSDYSHASAAYRARAEFKDSIDGALKDMRKITDDDRTSPNLLDRRRTVQEYEKRLEGFGSPEYMGKMGPVWQKVMLLSFLKRMASPAHLALHLMHPLMTSMPVIGGERGLTRTYREFARAYKEMGGVGALGEGAKGLYKQARDDGSPTNFGAYFRGQLKGSDREALGSMFKELEATGHLHPDAGFDVSRYSETNSKLDRGLGRVDRAFRELTGATESVNRYVTATAAYRLAVKDGMSPEQATRYAKDSIANTQGLYSATNAAPIFRNPALRPFMQFKQYPAMIIHLMGKLLYNTFKGETPEIKSAAMRSFAQMMGTAALLTGVNGLPTEVLKAPLMVGNALGVTPNWDTLDSEMRVGLAHELGPELSNLVMNGITSQGPLAVDAHHRLGYSSMLTFGEPKSDKPDDLKSWLFDTLGGAPASFAMDTMEGVKAALHGDIEGASEKLVPVKAIDDLAKAGRYTLEGKPTPSGKPGMAPLDAPAAVMQALGFTPRKVADYSEARYQAGQSLAEERQAKVEQNKTKKIGPKGAAILGISRNRKNAPTLNDYAQSYGTQ